MTSFAELLRRGPAPIDGGLASQLEAMGRDISGDLWSARVLVEDPDAIREVHRSYFAVGATIGISASYQASRSGFERHGIPHAEADRLMVRSVELVRQARDLEVSAGARQPMLVAASVGPFGATLHDGSEYRGRYGVAFERLAGFHAERIEVLLAAGPDLLAIETIPDVDEARAIIAALRIAGATVPAWLSFSCGDDRRTWAGQDIEVAAAVVAGADELDAVGINCTSPGHVTGLVRRIRRQAPDLPVVVYPNAGRPWDGTASRWLGPGRIPEATVAEWLDLGVDLVGGCCGVGPDAIASMAEVTRVRREAP